MQVWGAQENNCFLSVVSVELLVFWSHLHVHVYPNVSVDNFRVPTFKLILQFHSGACKSIVNIQVYSSNARVP